MSTWSPLPNLLFGRVTKPFLPLEKTQDKTNKRLLQNFRNIYPGDLVYLFESDSNSKWARGYIISLPIPSDFSSASVNLEKLPESRVTVCVIPFECVRILKEIAISTDDDLINPNLIIDDTIAVDEMDDTSSILTSEHKRLKKPNLPIDNQLDTNNLLEEIVLALKNVAVHIYALYAMNDFNLFKKLVDIYDELDSIRLNLSHDLLTKYELSVSKKQAVLLLNKIAKLLASRSYSHTNKHNKRKDIGGYEAIFSRDESTAEIYSSNVEDPEKNLISLAKLAQNQLFSALSPNYPLLHSNMNFVPEKHSKFDRVPPSHVLIDFKSVSGSSNVLPKGYDGMTAYMYLRNAKKRLTEAFAITIRPDQDLLLDSISAALFKNIPTSEVDSGRIYLVALLTENINLDTSIEKNGLTYIRKGIAAGVADVSRIFSRRKGHLASGEAHHFSIKLYSSYMNANQQPVQLTPGMNPMMAMSLTMSNNGWGELVDRIISGSNKGVVVNPRAERLTLSIKELRNESFLKGHFDSNITVKKDGFVSTAISPIRTMSYNSLESDYDRIYLKVVRAVNVNVNSKEKSFVTVEMKTSTPNLNFSKGTNETPKGCWQFLSVSSNEYVNETIQVVGFDINPTNENDYLFLTLYLNGEYLGDGKYLLRSHNHINDTGKKSKMVEITGAGNQNVGSVELELDFVGKHYNIDTYVETILNWKKIFERNIENTEKNLISALLKLNKVDVLVVVKYFSDLLLKMIEIYDIANVKNLDQLKTTAFESIVHLLDISIARHDQYIYLFTDFITKYTTEGYKLPGMGESMLATMTSYFAKSSSEWNSTGRALCRISILILQLCGAGVSDQDQFVKNGYLFVDSVSMFLSSSKESIVADQLLILEVLELWMEVLGKYYPEDILLGFAIRWLDSIGLRGLGSIEDSSSNALVNKKKNKEHRVIITKLLLVRRLIHSWCSAAKNKTVRERLAIYSFRWALEILVNKKIDLDASRLATGILLSLVTTSFGKDRLYTDESNQLYLAFTRSLPLLCGIFNIYFKHCKVTGLLRPKRTFTQLFPTSYPFVEFTMDSLVNDESFAEILIEMSVLLVYISKIGSCIPDTVRNFLLTGNVAPAYEMLNDLIGSSDKLLESHDLNLEIITTIRYLIQSKFYPGGKWFSLKSMLIESMQNYLELLLPIVSKLIPPVEQSVKFDKVFFTNYLKCVLRCATSQISSLEHLIEMPKKCCYQITGDIRTRSASLAQNIWAKLAWDGLDEDVTRFQLSRFGGYQVEFVNNSDYSIIEDLLSFSLQRNEKCLEVGVDMLWSTIVSEWVISENLFEIERECIIALYEIFHTEGKYSPELFEIKNFISQLRSVIKLDIEDEAYRPVMKLVDTLSEFLNTLFNLKSIPAGEEFDDDRTFHKLNISSYLMKVNKPELFQSFINEMYENYLSKKNYIQAALSLELLADTYGWDMETMLPSCAKPRLPSQSAFKRKEELYKLIAKNFINGNKLEQAVEVYQSLLEAYYKYNFDLTGLSYCHGELSSIYEGLEQVDRLDSNFFKISFIGFGFPDSIRGKEFIYEGLPFEHITSMNQRLSRLYPGSRIISNEEEAKRMLQDTPFGKHLHIKTVSPLKEITKSSLSYMTKQYVDNKNLKTFISVRRLPGSNSITNLWTEEITYESSLTFPTLMNRSEIKSVRIVKRSPIENAIRSLIDKNEELATMEYNLNMAIKDSAGDVKNISNSAMFDELSRNLSGTVDSPVNGGVGQYRVFFEGESELSEDAQFLKAKFLDLIGLLNGLLKLHGLLIPPTLNVNHETLMELFRKNFKAEIEELGLTSNNNGNVNVNGTISNGNGAIAFERLHGVTGTGYTPSYYSSGMGTTTTDSSSSLHRSFTGHESTHSDSSLSKFSNGLSSVQSRYSSNKKTVLNFNK
ncbi:hypothetical protein CANARDRAFT_29204 [[Candida] arabinofermentans NRRL YB-2248]|uniref:DOCKER domain-containing protein n=1 Tax=[Candida] arabinofermentans NRRL YB-2248 TaxID=983967 RepID=A0A1E4SXV2_9ASCO|nr:hypothetical protein CANARDRAFT_29204 [[Candida] arabinofermentans NRRL YB-2248]